MNKIALFSLALILVMGAMGVSYAVLNYTQGTDGRASNGGTHAPGTDSIGTDIIVDASPGGVQTIPFEQAGQIVQPLNGAEPMPWIIVDTWDTEVEGKDVSSVTATIENAALVVHINNAYPSIWYYVDWALQNTSGIEIILGSFDVISSSLPGGTDITITDYTGYHMFPDETIYGQLGLHLNNDALQGDIYYFLIEEVSSSPA